MNAITVGHETRGPSFLCIGMPKCGTSTLQSMFHDYTEFYVPPVKEIKFFARDQIGYYGGLNTFLFSRHWAARQERRAVAQIAKQILKNRESTKNLIWAFNFVTATRNLEWYMGLFPSNKISGDISPAYHTLNDQEVSSIRKNFPDLKIIILLRNPFEQIWSHCRMSTRGVKIDSAVDFYRQQIDRQLKLCPRYSDLIERWRKVFGKENVIIEYLENLSANPHEVLCRLVNFVDSSEDSLDRIVSFKLTPPVFTGRKQEMPLETHDMIRSAALKRIEGFDHIDENWARRWLNEIEHLSSV